MTATELNRDIKRLYNKIEYLKCKSNNDDYFFYLDNEGKKEFLRLYRADSDFSSLNLLSVKILMVLNRRYKYIPFYSFMININL